MKRRTFVLGLGTTATGASTLIGSGAFSSAEAERAVSVETADDDDAYLALIEGESATDDRSYRDDGQLSFSFPGLRERLDGPGDTNPENPEGLGEDTVYRFGSETDGDPLFFARNQGTQTIELYSRQDDTDGLPHVKIFNRNTGNLLTENGTKAVLESGESVPLGLLIDTTGIDAQESAYSVPLTIVGKAMNG
ncbi:hypothetical protein [Halolamina rubra]|uniref:hypothetical protein n=1 Tax=Halolamina rubra TaxID=1380430 RepID=UPI0012AC2FDC|nr:hypothetical protein [Halolamina rubra]